MYLDFKLANDRPAYIQVKDYMKRLMTTGAASRSEAPSTRELSALFRVGRNTVLSAYSDLEDEGYIYAVKGQGHFVVPSISGAPMRPDGKRLDWGLA